MQAWQGQNVNGEIKFNNRKIKIQNILLFPIYWVKGGAHSSPTLVSVPAFVSL